MAIAAWLSERRIEVLACGKSNSSSKFLCHITCLTACVAAVYSASAVDNAVRLCFFELQATAPPHRVKT
jgi:hypothetical protein